MSRRSARISIGLAALCVGVTAGGIVVVIRYDSVTSGPPRAEPAVPLAREARASAAAFINTAVKRKNLRRAWKYSGPAIRCQTLRLWLTGNIPVLPYPDADLTRSVVRVERSLPTAATLRIHLKPKRGSVDRAQVFYLDLIKRRSPGSPQWVVNGWTSNPPPIPSNPAC
jgi:hypothetical protein